MAVEIHEHDAGLTWVVTGEAMARASHALADDGRVWLVDPVDDGAALQRAAGLGEIVGVLQLLDRHERAGAAIAARFGVGVARLPSAVPGSPFEAFPIVDVPGWREVGLWWPQRRTLVVPEAVGTAPYCAVGSGRLGVHPLLRAFGVGRLRVWQPELVLVGHGPPLSGPDASGELGGALDHSRSDLPRLLAALPRIIRGG